METDGLERWGADRDFVLALDAVRVDGELPEWAEVFARCYGWIEAALARSGGTHHVVDVFDRVARGQAQFWSDPEGCAVTEIVAHPRCKELNGWLAGGSLEAAERIEAYVEDYARRNKCRRIVTTCRRGWERSWMTKRRGYVAEQVTLTKEL
jgi:hypothetical protein